MESPTVFLTGGTGFLGGVLLQQFLRGGYRVRMLARQVAGIASQPPLELVQGDLSDAVRLAEQMKGCAAIAHCAALVSTWERDEREFYRVNLEGFRNVLAASQSAGALTLLYTSTFFALGPADTPGATEESGLNDCKRHPYQHSKLMARKEARQALASGYPIVILYPGVVYGPGRRTQGNLVVQLIADFLAGKIPGLLGNGSQVWSYSYVQDVARGHILALERCGSGGECVLGGDNVSLREFFQILGRLVGKPAPRLKIPISAGLFLGGMQVARAKLTGHLPQMTPATVRLMAENWACDSSKARRELGYEFRSLEQGLRETVEWMGISVGPK